MAIVCDVTALRVFSCTCTYFYWRFYADFVNWHAVFVAVTAVFVCVRCFSGEGSQISGNSDERNLQAMARAISVHPGTCKVMYFA